MKLKNLFASLLVFSFLALPSIASDFGYIDMAELMAGYKKAQNLAADASVKEAELQTFLADAKKRLKTTSSPVERKNLETKLTKEFQAKTESFKTSQLKEWKAIDDEVFTTIKTVAGEKELDSVLNKQAVFYGGIDITKDVLKKLNK